MLVFHFIDAIRQRLSLPQRPTLAPRAIETLMRYTWPGNVRELENLVERVMTLTPQGPLELHRHLPRDTGDAGVMPAAERSGRSDYDGDPRTSRAMQVRHMPLRQE